MNLLQNNLVISGTILLKTGLHIGGGTEGIEIGGIDNPVIKDPWTGYPFIPGSSLKGKIRSLLELFHGIKSNDKDKPCKCGECKICRAFGNSNSKSMVGITRLIFRDAFLSEESKKILNLKNILATEAKMENVINRIKGTAEHPRTTERAIAGLIFDFTVLIRVFKEDDSLVENEKPIFLLKQGLSLLKKDALGGSGSRGYGKIEFQNLKLDGADFKLD